MGSKEIWRDIPEYEGRYYISDTGKVMNRNGLVLKPMVCTNGYLAACLWKDGVQSKKLIHRLVAEVFIPKNNHMNEVNHIDENKTNNRVENLEWCTHLYNMNYGSVGDKISKARKGMRLTESHRKKCGFAAKGKKWVHNDLREILVRKDDVPSFLLEGWILGRKVKNV